MRHENFRPRGGVTVTLGAGATSSHALPTGTNQAIVTCTANAGRVAVGVDAAAPALADSTYGYFASNNPVHIKFGDAEKRLYLGSTVAGNIFYVTFGN